MPRKPRDQLFKKSDVYRLIEAARAKGLPVRRIDIKRDGMSLIIGEPSNDNGKNEGNKNDIENWIAKHEHQN
jgi:hypothetical protein